MLKTVKVVIFLYNGIMIIKRQFKMYNITIHNTQHLCLVENVAKHSVCYNSVLHFDPASLRLHDPAYFYEK